MNVNEEKQQPKVLELSRDKDRAIAAGIGAVVGGAAFATAANSAGIWDENPETNNDTLESTEQSINSIAHSEIISVEMSTPTETVAPIESGISETSSPVYDDGISIINIENNDIVVESIEYPDEGYILQSDTQVIMDLSLEQTTYISTIESPNSINDDISIDDSHIHLI